MVRRALLLVACGLALAGASRGSVIVARGQWAAIDHGASCEALTRSQRIAAKGKVQAIAGFGFHADRSRWGEFRARMSRLPRPGSSVMLVVAGERFLLVGTRNFAWSRDALQQQAIIAAVRAAGSMRVEARDQAGRRFSDPYLLDGAPTAIDAAAARCAGKMVRR